MVFLQPDDLVLFGSRTEPAGGLDGDGQASGGDHFLAAVAVVTPGGEWIPIPILCVLDIAVPATVRRASVVTDGLDDFPPGLPGSLGRQPATDEFVLGAALVFERTALAAIGERRQRPGVQALLFQRRVPRPFGLVTDDNDIGEADVGEERSEEHTSE